MRYIIEHFGAGILNGTAAVLLIPVFVAMLRQGGILNAVIAGYMAGITG